MLQTLHREDMVFLQLKGKPGLLEGMLGAIFMFEVPGLDTVAWPLCTRIERNQSCVF